MRYYAKHLTIKLSESITQASCLNK